MTEAHSSSLSSAQGETENSKIDVAVQTETDRQFQRLFEELGIQQNKVQRAQIELDAQRTELREHKSIIYLGFVIIIVMVSSMIIDAFRFRQGIGVDVFNQITSQKEQTNILSERINQRNEEIGNLGSKLDIIIEELSKKPTSTAR